MYLFCDTETAGLPDDYEAPPSDYWSWPRLVQIAWILTDESGAEMRSQSFIIQPEGFEIPLSATRVHGISTESASKLGIRIGTALRAFSKDLKATDTLVAHNIQFDERVIAAEYFRLGRVKNPLEKKARFCTMRSTAELCKIKKGPRGYKWPSLTELHTKLFGEGFPSAHDAKADVKACAKCFFHLKSQGLISGRESPERNKQRENDEDLFDYIYYLANRCYWFDTSLFVDDVHQFFKERGFITEGQREKLYELQSMLEERAD